MIGHSERNIVLAQWATQFEKIRHQAEYNAIPLFHLAHRTLVEFFFKTPKLYRGRAGV